MTGSIELLLAKASRDPDTGCWGWTAATDYKGYGKLGWRGRTSLAHRVAWEVFRGPIPPDMQLDHLCRTRCCINPDHLRVCTNRENVLCGIGVTARNATATHCPRGHALSGDNLYLQDRTKRSCKTCRTARNRIRRLKWVCPHVR